MSDEIDEYRERIERRQEERRLKTDRRKERIEPIKRSVTDWGILVELMILGLLTLGVALTN